MFLNQLFEIFGFAFANIGRRRQLLQAHDSGMCYIQFNCMRQPDRFFERRMQRPVRARFARDGGVNDEGFRQ